jgi:hypothetical protein
VPSHVTDARAQSPSVSFPRAPTPWSTALSPPRGLVRWRRRSLLLARRPTTF